MKYKMKWNINLYIGLKHIEPFIEDAVEAMVKDGIREAVSIVLAPHFSTFSIKSYNGRAKEAAEKLGSTLNITSVEAWYDEPKFIEYWKQAILAEFDEMTEEESEKACVIVSNHSLPEKIKNLGDPYEEQFIETARLIFKKKRGFKILKLDGNLQDKLLNRGLVQMFKI